MCEATFPTRRTEWNQHRGGLLTQSGLMAMNSNGTDSHPLKRGVWLLRLCSTIRLHRHRPQYRSSTLRIPRSKMTLETTY
jgi:hypothetical protein